MTTNESRLAGNEAAGVQIDDDTTVAASKDLHHGRGITPGYLQGLADVLYPGFVAGQPVPGGCDHCDAEQYWCPGARCRLYPSVYCQAVALGIAVSMHVVHADDCPTLRFHRLTAPEQHAVNTVRANRVERRAARRRWRP